MTVAFAGGELGSFLPSDSTVIEGATAGRFNPSFTRSYVFCDKDSNYGEIDPAGTLTDVWAHLDLAIRGGGTGSTARIRFVWLDGSGVERVRLTHRYDTDALALQYDVGAGWVTAGATIALDLSVVQTIDINAVVNSATGSLTLYVGGTERITSGTINLSAITALDKARVYGATIPSLGFGTYPSQVIVATVPTIGWRLMTFYPSGAGADTAWTGTYTEVDENATNDADYINSSVADQVETFALTPVGSITGYAARAVIVTARAKRGASGPANLRFIIRSGGSNYDNGADISLSLGYTAKQAVWETDPATSAAWTNAAILAMQAGVKSRT